MRLWKNRPKCSQTHSLLKLIHYVCILRKKVAPNFGLCTSVIVICITAKTKRLPIGRKFAQSGHPEREATLPSRVARFFLIQHTKRGGYTKWPYHTYTQWP
jgi:hypothetical protein